MVNLERKIHYGRNIKTVTKKQNDIVMKLSDNSGEGLISIHKIFHGAYLIRNDMHLSQCISEFKLNRDTNFFCIDHCREGCIETEVGKGVYRYLVEHELSVDNRENHEGIVNFPMNHYHGISIGFDLQVAQPEIQQMYGGFSVNLYELRDKYCGNSKPYVIKNEPGIEHIFSELYHIPGQIREEYYKVKTLELLLYLDALHISDAKEERPYFYIGQVEKIKAIHTLITSDLQKHYTLEELSERYKISMTAVKTCFKQIYGDSVYSYQKRYRMNLAASMLQQDRKKTVAEIAGMVGYESQSKFTTAFRSIIGCTPLEYRKSVMVQ